MKNFIVYIIFINGVVISNDKNKDMLEKKILKDQDYQMLKKHQEMV